MPFVEITDFSPGIHSHPSLRAPLGAAVKEGTFMCRSEGKALVPGPRIVEVESKTVDSILAAAVDHGTAEVQQLQMDGGAGTFTLSWDGQGPTGTIPFDSIAGVVQTALETLSNVDVGDIVVTGGPGGIAGLTPYIFTWTTLAADEAEHTCDDALITGAGATVSTLTTGVAPTGFTQAVLDGMTLPDDIHSNEGVFISGVRAVGPLFDANDNTVRGPDLNRSEIIVGMEWWKDNDPSQDDQFLYAWRYHRNRNTPAWTIMAGYPVVNLATADFAGPYGVFGRMTIEFSRMNASSHLEVGPPVVCTLPYRGVPLMFPDPAANSTDSSAEIIDSGNVNHDDDNAVAGNVLHPPEEMVAHQGRMVLFPHIPYAYGSADLNWSNQEGYYHTEVNDFLVCGEGVGFLDQTLPSEEPSGFATFGSMSGDDLFLLKRRGGAQVLRGGLSDDPTIRSLPSVKSPGFAQNKGVTTPVGFAYCCENGGVWTWEGGDTATPIAQSQVDDFWRPVVSRNYAIGPTNMSSWQEWIMAPNNYMYDIIDHSWWKFFPNQDDIDFESSNTWLPFEWTFAEEYGVPFWHSTVDHNDRWAYMTPEFISDASNNGVIYEFDKRLRSQIYTWISHPLDATSTERKHEVKAVSLTASGTGIIKVTVRGQSGKYQTLDFEVDSTFPTKMVQPIRVHDTHIQIMVSATGDDVQGSFDTGTLDPSDLGDYEAPTIYAVGIDVNESHKVQLADSTTRANP